MQNHKIQNLYPITPPKQQMTTKLQQMMFRKEYEQVQSELTTIRKEDLSVNEQIIYDMSQIRMSMWQVTALRRQAANFHQFLALIEETCQKYASRLPGFVLTIHSYAMRAFLFQIETDVQEDRKQDMERKFIKEITKLPPLADVYDSKVRELIDKSLYFVISLLEIYVKKNTRVKRKQQKAELDLLAQIITELVKRKKQVSVLCKRLYIIVIHLKLHNLNTFASQLPYQTIEYLNLSIVTIEGKQQTLISYETVVVLLYNCLKIMLGFNELNGPLVERLEELYRLFGMKSVKRSYSWHVLQMFFIIKIIIFRQKDDIQEKDKIEEKLSEFSEKFSVFLNMNLDEIIVSLNDITRNIVRHKVASLSTIIGIKLGIRRFSKDFLQIMHDSPFNNDVQTIKLCFELFEFRQYDKIENLLQTVLSVPATKKLKMREVLVAMCSILISLFLEHREEGLLYNKLNHENYLSLKQSKNITGKNQILKEETFLQHVGFGYYNMACHQIYLQNRQIYLTKALQNFLLSYELNPENYLLNYCIGKIYLQMYNYQNAYKHAMEACRSHRGSWAPFCLLACVYMCDRKFHKAYLLIQQLFKKYDDVPVLHYVRAYLQANKILLDVEHDEEIEAAKMLGDEYYTTHFQRLLKHKSIVNFTQYCQSYYQLALDQALTDPDENFFAPHNLNSDDPESYKYLFQIISLFEELSQYNVVEGILKVLPPNNLETLYHKALLHGKRKQMKQAQAQLLNIIKINHAHTPTLIKLAMMPKNEDYDSYKECYEYIDAAGKYVNNGDFMLAKGVILSKLGMANQANKALLANRDLAWCGMLPDLLFYY